MAAYIPPTPHYGTPPGYTPTIGYIIPPAPCYITPTHKDRGKLDCRAPDAVDIILAMGAPLQETA